MPSRARHTCDWFRVHAGDMCQATTAGVLCTKLWHATVLACSAARLHLLPAGQTPTFITPAFDDPAATTTMFNAVSKHTRRASRTGTDATCTARRAESSGCAAVHDGGGGRGAAGRGAGASHASATAPGALPHAGPPLEHTACACGADTASSRPETVVGGASAPLLASSSTPSTNRVSTLAGAGTACGKRWDDESCARRAAASFRAET